MIRSYFPLRVKKTTDALPSVIIFFDNFLPGGLEQTVCDYASFFSSSDILVVSGHRDFSVRKFCEAKGIAKEDLRLWHTRHFLQVDRWSHSFTRRAVCIILDYFDFVINTILSLAFFAQQRNAHAIIAINGGYPASRNCLAFLLAAKILNNTKLIHVVLSQPTDPSRSILWKLAETLFDRLALIVDPLMICNSHSAEKALRQRFRDRIRTKTIHTGISFDESISTEPDASLRLKFDEPELPLLGIISLITRGKGHFDLLEAVARLRSRYVKVNVAIAGVGPDTESLVLEIASKGLSANVKLIGRVSSSNEFLRSIDIFVFPTHYEGLPYAVSEAMRMAKPIIASKVGDIPIQVVDGHSGLLVEPYDSEGLAHSIMNLVEDRALASRLGLAAAERARCLFDIKKTRSELLAIVSQAKQPNSC